VIVWCILEVHFRAREELQRAWAMVRITLVAFARPFLQPRRRDSIENDAPSASKSQPGSQQIWAFDFLFLNKFCTRAQPASANPGQGVSRQNSVSLSKE
jgi:hypothetical protein